MVLQHTLYLEPDELIHMLGQSSLTVGAGSPLSFLDGRYGDEFSKRGADSVARTLIDKGATRSNGTPNELIAGVLRAAAQPEEVLALATGDTSATGFTIVRRGGVTAECTVGAGGLTKLVAPLDRPTVLVGLMKMLSGPTPDVRAGFDFSGDAKQAFTLATAVGHRRKVDVAPTLPDLAAAIAADLDSPLAWSFKLAGGPDVLAALRDPDMVELTVRRLIDAGHLVSSQDRLHLSPPLLAVSSEEPSGMFAFSRGELVDGQMHTSRISVTRTGPYRLLFRSLVGGGVVWRDVTQQELRRLVAAMWLTADERATATVG